MPSSAAAFVCSSLDFVPSILHALIASHGSESKEWLSQVRLINRLFFRLTDATFWREVFFRSWKPKELDRRFLMLQSLALSRPALLLHVKEVRTQLSAGPPSVSDRADLESYARIGIVGRTLMALFPRIDSLCMGYHLLARPSAFAASVNLTSLNISGLDNATLLPWTLHCRLHKLVLRDFRFVSAQFAAIPFSFARDLQSFEMIVGEKCAQSGTENAFIKHLLRQCYRLFILNVVFKDPDTSFYRCLVDVRTNRLRDVTLQTVRGWEAFHELLPVLPRTVQSFTTGVLLNGRGHAALNLSAIKRFISQRHLRTLHIAVYQPGQPDRLWLQLLAAMWASTGADCMSRDISFCVSLYQFELIGYTCTLFARCDSAQVVIDMARKWEREHHGFYARMRQRTSWRKPEETTLAQVAAWRSQPIRFPWLSFAVLLLVLLSLVAIIFIVAHLALAMFRQPSAPIATMPTATMPGRWFAARPAPILGPPPAPRLPLDTVERHRVACGRLLPTKCQEVRLWAIAMWRYAPVSKGDPPYDYFDYFCARREYFLYSLYCSAMKEEVNMPWRPY